MIKVSIIVPIYKVEYDLLKRCIESLTAQTLKEIEIILVDDGSPDKCGQICDEYAVIDNRINVIHKANGGVSSARNSGVSVAKGEYIGFVDADDYVKTDFCKTLFSAVKSQNADMVCSGYTELKNNKFRENNVCEDKKNVSMNKKDAIEQFILFKKIDFRVWNKLFRRDIAKKMSFSEDYRIAEDELYIYDFLCRAKKILYIPYAGYIYYINLNSVMSSSFSNKNFDALKVTENISHRLLDQKTENINYYKLNIYIRLWVKIISDDDNYDKFKNEKSYIEDKIKQISFFKVKYYGNKTLMIMFVPMKISCKLVEAVLKRMKIISKKISL